MKVVLSKSFKIQKVFTQAQGLEDRVWMNPEWSHLEKVILKDHKYPIGIDERVKPYEIRINARMRMELMLNPGDMITPSIEIPETL